MNAIITFLSTLTLCAPALSAESTGPNVILIITDDQGYGDVSAHGNPVLKTPNVDLLAEQSVRFTDFHVAPMCSPTRGQLMTGIDAMRNGCTAVCQGRSMIRSELPTMADFFARSGYATGHFGKWHLGDSYPHRPQDRGFQETLHHRAWGITSLADYWGNTYFDPVLSHNGTDKKYEGYCTDIFFGEAMKWIETQSDNNKPFFCYLPTNTPHVPDVCAEKYSKRYVGEHEGKPMPAKFYGMIANLDENLGKLESFLNEKGLRDNTLLIYMADNGTQSQRAQAIFNAGMRAKKTSVYEGGHRVPLFVRWPAGGLQHGRNVDELAQVQDLLPTLIDLCGLKNESKAAFDGLSLAGLLKGTAGKLPDRKLVVQYRVSGEPWNPAVVLWGKWRLLNETKRKNPKRANRKPELYHVGRDPGQTQNVAAKHPDVVVAMTKHYEAWHSEARQLFDRERWITVGSKQANPMVLYSQDWVGDYCDNPKGLSQATARGYWNVIVDREGIYEVELRRWPKESNKTLTEGWKGPQDKGPSARPIAAANLQVAGVHVTVGTKPTDTHAMFHVRLPAGRTRLSTTLKDAEGRALCSAIYVYVHRLDETEASKVKLTGAAVQQATSATDRPNIVLIFIDDMGYGDLAIQNPESKIATPHLDRLAQEGVRFTDAHSSSGICTPSRYALLTGRYHWRKFHSIVNSWGDSVFAEDRLTLPEMLQEKGYHTACIGKWHLGFNWEAIRKPDAKPVKAGKRTTWGADAFDWSKPIPNGPLDHGFDYYFGDDVPNFPPYTWIENDRVTEAPTVPYFPDPRPSEGAPEGRPGPMVEGWKQDAVMPTLTKRAVEWIAEQKGGDKPFFLYWPWTSPHAPIVPTKDWQGKTKAGGYGDFMAQSDDHAGDVLKALDDNGFRENTIVIFTADNGPEKYAYERVRKFDHRSSGPLRGLKRDIWEGGHRVPFVVRWPGVVKAGSVTDGLMSQIDIMSTLAAIVGVELPGDAADDSHNQLDLWKGGTSARTSIVHNTREGNYAIRKDNWVLIDAPSGNVSSLPKWFAEKNGYANTRIPARCSISEPISASARTCMPNSRNEFDS